MQRGDTCLALLHVATSHALGIALERVGAIGLIILQREGAQDALTVETHEEIRIVAEVVAQHLYAGPVFSVELLLGLNPCLWVRRHETLDVHAVAIVLHAHLDRGLAHLVSVGIAV